MPPIAKPWFRFHSCTIESRKAQTLGRKEPGLYFHWINLLCLANVTRPRGTLPPVEDIAYKLRLGREKAEGIIEALIARRFIDQKGDTFEMHDWEDWQADRDVAPVNRRGKGTPSSQETHANVTPSSQENHANVTHTVAENHDRVEERRVEERRGEEIAPAPSGAAPEKAKRERVIPLSAIDDTILDDLQEKHPGIDVRREFSKFQNNLKAKGLKYQDYSAAFRNWLLKGEDIERINATSRLQNGRGPAGAGLSPAEQTRRRLADAAR